MPFDKDGNFTRNQNWKNDKDSQTPIITQHHDDEDDNFAAGFNNCVTRDGAGKFTAPVDFTGHKGVNVADGQYLADAINAKQLMQGANFFIDVSTTANKIVISTGSIELEKLVNGQRFFIKCNNANTTGDVTLKVNSISADVDGKIISDFPVVTRDGLELAPDAISAQCIREFLFYNNKFYAITGAAANTLPLLSWFMTDAKFDTTELNHFGYALQGSVCDGNIYVDAYNKLVEEYNDSTFKTDSKRADITYRQSNKTYRRFYTAEMYRAMIFLDGSCMGYVLNQTEKTFQLPCNNNYYRSTTDKTDVLNGYPISAWHVAEVNQFEEYTTINITGSVGAVITKITSTNYTPSVAFQKYGPEIRMGRDGGTDLTFQVSTMDLSGKFPVSREVRPNSFGQFVYYIVGNTIVNYGKIDLNTIKDVAIAAKTSADQAKVSAQEAKDASKQAAIYGSDVSNFIEINAKSAITIYDGILTIAPGLKLNFANGRDENGKEINTEFVTSYAETFNLNVLDFTIPQLICKIYAGGGIKNYSYVNHNETFEDADIAPASAHALWFLNSENKMYEYSPLIDNLSGDYDSKRTIYDFIKESYNGQIKFLCQTENFIVVFCDTIYLPNGAEKPVSDIFITDKNMPIKWYKNHIVYESPINAGAVIKAVKYNQENKQFYLLPETFGEAGIIVKFFCGGNEYEKTENIIVNNTGLDLIELYKNHIYCCATDGNGKIYYSADYGQTFIDIYDAGIYISSVSLYYNPDASDIKYGIIFGGAYGYVYYAPGLGQNIKAYQFLDTLGDVKAVLCGKNVFFGYGAYKTDLFYGGSANLTHIGTGTHFDLNSYCDLNIDHVNRIGFVISNSGRLQVCSYSENQIQVIDDSLGGIRDALIVGSKVYCIENQKLTRYIITPFTQILAVPVATVLKTEQGEIISANIQNDLYILNAEQIKERLDGFIRDIGILNASVNNALLPTNPPPYQNNWLFGADSQKRPIWVALDDLKATKINDSLKQLDYTRIISLSVDRKVFFLKTGAVLEIANGMDDNGNPLQYQVTINDQADLHVWTMAPNKDKLLIYVAGEGFWLLKAIDYNQFEILNVHPNLSWNDNKGMANYPDIDGNPSKTLYFSKPANSYYYRDYTGGGLQYILTYSSWLASSHPNSIIGDIAADDDDNFILTIANNIDVSFSIAAYVTKDLFGYIDLNENFNVKSACFGGGVWLVGGYGDNWWAPIFRCDGDPRIGVHWTRVPAPEGAAGWDEVTKLKYFDGNFYAVINNDKAIKISTDNGNNFISTTFNGGAWPVGLNIIDIFKTDTGLLACDLGNKKIYVSTTGTDWTDFVTYSSLNMSDLYAIIKHNGKWLFLGEYAGARVAKFTYDFQTFQDYTLAGGIIVKAAINYGNKTYLFGGIGGYNPTLVADLDSDTFQEQQIQAANDGWGIKAIVSNNNFILKTSNSSIPSYFAVIKTRFVKAPVFPIAKFTLDAQSCAIKNSIVSVDIAKNYPAFLDFIEKENLKENLKKEKAGIIDEIQSKIKTEMNTIESEVTQVSNVVETQKNNLQDNYLTMQEVYNSFASTYTEIESASGAEMPLTDVVIGQDLKYTVLDLSQFTVGKDLGVSLSSTSYNNMIIFQGTKTHSLNYLMMYCRISWYHDDENILTITLIHNKENPGYPSSTYNNIVLLDAIIDNNGIITTINQKNDKVALIVDDIEFGAVTEMNNNGDSKLLKMFKYVNCINSLAPSHLVNLPFLRAKIGYDVNAQIELNAAGEYTSEPLSLRQNFSIRELKAVITNGAQIKGIAPDKLNFNIGDKTVTITIDEDLTGWTAMIQVIYDVVEI
jgi:flagellar capping protein FliD